MMLKKLFLLIAMAILCIIPVSAAAAEKEAQVRFGNFALGTPEVNVFIDGAVVKTTTSPSIVLPLKLSPQYVNLKANAPHTFTVVPDGKPLGDAIISPKAFTLIDGHQYTLAMMGNVASKDLHFDLIDETTALVDKDLSTGAVSVVMNNLAGIPAVDFYWGGKLLIDKLAYGDHVVLADPQGSVGSKTTPHGDAKTAIFDFPEALPGPAHCLAYFVFVGVYPGEVWADYSVTYLGSYVGKVSVDNRGTIAVGDVRTVKLTALGQRMAYTLVLDKDSKLDITIAGGKSAPGVSHSDAVLRIYNAQDEMIVESDDGADVNIAGMTLNAGTYRLEVASFSDVLPGEYTLSVLASK